MVTGPRCNQAFRLGERAWGIQFHAEVTLETVRMWLDDKDEFPLDLDRDALWAETQARIGEWNALGRKLCGAFVEVAERSAVARLRCASRPSGSRGRPTGSTRSSASTATGSGCRSSAGSRGTRATTASSSASPARSSTWSSRPTWTGARGPAPTRDNLLVFYLENEAEVAAVAARLAAMGYPEVESENPYWPAHGRASRSQDPDGWRVVLVPPG